MRMVVFREKHGSRYFLLEAPEGSEQETQQLHNVALKVFGKRFSGDWYECTQMTATQRRYGDAKAALAFLNSRRSLDEYESFEIVDVETA